MTWGRDNTYVADGNSFVHLPMGQPYCENLRRRICKISEGIDLSIIPRSTVVVIQGPRFSTSAESKWFSFNGWDIVNMTQYPECYFAKELGLCYASISAITDYDVGLHEKLTIDHLRMNDILKVFKTSIQKTKLLLLALIESSSEIDCNCASTVLKNYYELP